MELDNLDSAFSRNASYRHSPPQQRQHHRQGDGNNQARAQGTNNNNDNNHNNAAGDASMNTAGGDAETQRASWTPDREYLLAEICIELKREGYGMPGNFGFSRDAWIIAHQKFAEAARVEWTIAQLKARYQRLRMDYEAFKLLKQAVLSEGGHWNEETLMLDGTEEMKQTVTAANRKDRVYFQQSFVLYPLLYKLFDADWDEQTQQWLPREATQPGNTSTIDAGPLSALVATQTRRARGQSRSGTAAPRNKRRRSSSSGSQRDPLEGLLGPNAPLSSTPLQPIRPHANRMTSQPQMNGVGSSSMTMSASQRMAPELPSASLADLSADHAQLTRAFVEANKAMLQSTLKELASLTHPRQVQLALHKYHQHAVSKRVPVRVQIICKEILCEEHNAEVWLTLPADQYKVYFEIKMRQRGVQFVYEEK